MKKIAPFLLAFFLPLIAILLLSLLFYKTDKGDVVIDGKFIIEGELVIPMGKSLVVHYGSEIVFRDGIIICYGPVFSLGDPQKRISVSCEEGRTGSIEFKRPFLLAHVKLANWDFSSISIGKPSSDSHTVDGTLSGSKATHFSLISGWFLELKGCTFSNISISPDAGEAEASLFSSSRLLIADQCSFQNVFSNVGEKTFTSFVKWIFPEEYYYEGRSLSINSCIVESTTLSSFSSNASISIVDTSFQNLRINDANASSGYLNRPFINSGTFLRIIDSQFRIVSDGVENVLIRCLTPTLQVKICASEFYVVSKTPVSLLHITSDYPNFRKEVIVHNNIFSNIPTSEASSDQDKPYLVVFVGNPSCTDVSFEGNKFLFGKTARIVIRNANFTNDSFESEGLLIDVREDELPGTIFSSCVFRVKDLSVTRLRFPAIKGKEDKAVVRFLDCTSDVGFPKETFISEE